MSRFVSNGRVHVAGRFRNLLAPAPTSPTATSPAPSRAPRGRRRSLASEGLSLRITAAAGVGGCRAWQRECTPLGHEEMVLADLVGLLGGVHVPVADLAGCGPVCAVEVEIGLGDVAVDNIVDGQDDDAEDGRFTHEVLGHDANLEVA